MQKSSGRARALAVAGLAAGALTFLSASPAGAIGVRPEDPTSTPASTAPPPRTPPPGAPAPAPAPAPVPPAAAPAPAPAPAPARAQAPQPRARSKFGPVDPVDYAVWY